MFGWVEGHYTHRETLTNHRQEVSTRAMRPARIGLWVGLLWLLAMRCLGGVPATAVAAITAGFVTGITVTSGGSGYASEPAVTITGGGGSGAAAKAILSGDKVAVVVVLTAGSGYTSAPTVSIDTPPKELGLVLEMVPKLTVMGPPGSLARVERSVDLSGPWTAWSNVVVSAEGVVLVDLMPGPEQRLYRAVLEQKAGGPFGFVWVEPGTFVMGSHLSEDGRVSNETQNTVTLTQGFWLSDHEVTQGEYQTVMGNNPSNFKGDPNRPVETVSWDDAVLYCRELTERERTAGRITAQQAYRLPTEAEWEYAARAGTTGARHGDLDAIAWWAGNSSGQTRPVKQKAPNAWGLHDMMGNVWEWCSDTYGDYPTGSLTDPTGPFSGPLRVARGGTWGHAPEFVRSACRFGIAPGSRSDPLGFRPALSSVRPQGPSGFVWIPPGTFVMGSPRSEPEREVEEIQHAVTLTEGYWMSDHEVTQGEYQKIMGNNPSNFKGDLNRPVEQVTWVEAVGYCKELTNQDRLAGRITSQQAYRLPTEAEWEYAARAGTVGVRYGELNAIAWWRDNAGNVTHPVKKMAPNAFGVYDMMGNVLEWCSDWYGEYPTGNVTDPMGPTTSVFRVFRGGGATYYNDPRDVRSAKRRVNTPSNRFNFLGFRPVLSSVR